MPTPTTSKSMRELVVRKLLQLAQAGLDNSYEARVEEIWAEKRRARPHVDRTAQRSAAKGIAAGELLHWTETATDEELLERILDAVKS